MASPGHQRALSVETAFAARYGKVVELFQLDDLPVAVRELHLAATAWDLIRFTTVVPLESRLRYHPNQTPWSRLSAWGRAFRYAPWAFVVVLHCHRLGPHMWSTTIGHPESTRSDFKLRLSRSVGVERLGHLRLVHFVATRCREANASTRSPSMITLQHSDRSWSDKHTTHHYAFTCTSDAVFRPVVSALQKVTAAAGRRPMSMAVSAVLNDMSPTRLRQTLSAWDPASLCFSAPSSASSISCGRLPALPTATRFTEMSEVSDVPHRSCRNSLLVSRALPNEIEDAVQP